MRARQIRSTSDANIILQHATCVRKTAHEYFVLEVCSHSFQIKIVYFEHIESLESVLAMHDKILSIDHYVT